MSQKKKESKKAIGEIKGKGKEKPPRCKRALTNIKDYKRPKFFQVKNFSTLRESRSQQRIFGQKDQG